jgi:hypothetical protein
VFTGQARLAAAAEVADVTPEQLPATTTTTTGEAPTSTSSVPAVFVEEKPEGAVPPADPTCR